MLAGYHTPYPNAGIPCPESILYLELIFSFAIFAFAAVSLARVILIISMRHEIREFSVPTNC